jgi:hypothetical protein
LQISIEIARSVRARLQSCRKWPIWIPALAATELQTPENINAGAKAQHYFVALSARLKSCPDKYCLRKVILQEAQKTEGFIQVISQSTE